MGDQRVKRYNSIAIILHWLMAIGFLLMLISGVIMSYAPIEQSLKFNLYQWHKAGGVLLLLAFGVRILWRLLSEMMKQVPALPSHFPKLERVAAKLGHWGLYGLMLALPLSGWVMVSSSVYGLPTIVFGWFEWPHIPNLSGNEPVEEMAKDAHFYLAILFGFIIVAHIGAVVKHALKDHENLMSRIWWSGLSPLWAVLVLALPLGWVALGAVSPSMQSSIATMQQEGSSYNRSSLYSGAFVIDHSASEISFSGMHAGNNFIGVFGVWEADINFDAANLEASFLNARFDMSSATTGNTMYDGTLPQTDWFDVSNHPEARFVSTSITQNDHGGFTANGDLTLRGITQPISFDFTLSDMSASPINVSASILIDRLAFDVGKKSDASASWVSRDIAVTLNLQTNPQ